MKPTYLHWCKSHTFTSLLLSIFLGIFTVSANAQSLAVTASTQLQSAEFAIDGDFNTRWESELDIDPSWITVNLGETKKLQSITIYWEAANAKDYLVRGWNGVNWDTLSTQEGKLAGNRVDTLELSGEYQYVQIYGTARSMGWGYSIWEIDIQATDIVAASPITVTASTQVQAAELAVDGDTNTRWESENINPSWFTLNLGSVEKINGITIHWADLNAKDYSIRGWNGVNWDTLATVTDQPAGSRTDTVELSGHYQYIQIYTIARSGAGGFSIWEIELDTTDINLVSPPLVTASTQVMSAELAIDGNVNTRWESENINPSWITVNLGEAKAVNGINIRWAAYNARSYWVRGWNGVNWDTLATKIDMPNILHRTDIIEFQGTYQYIQIYTIERSSADRGFSISEILVDVAE